MKKTNLITAAKILFLISILYGVGAQAKSNAGGLPQCNDNLINLIDLVASCNGNLDESLSILAVCQNSLATCEENASQENTNTLIINDSFTRFPDTSPSGSGHTVLGECGDSFSGASAKLEVRQASGTSQVKITMQNGKPNTVFDVWLRLKGSDRDGNTIGSSPLTGGASTPLTATTELGQLAADWVGTGNPAAPSSIITDSNGNATAIIELDFPLIGGVYPFNKMSDVALMTAQSRRSTATAAPTAIANPHQLGISSPYLLRIVSHCQDGLSHGLSPSRREAWFNY